MKHVVKFVVGAAALALVFVIPTFAQERLRPVGEITYEPQPVEPQTGTFRLQVQDRSIRSMRIVADEGVAEIRELRLIYRDGEEQRVRVRERIGEGQQTSLIRLKEPRPLREIQVIYMPEGRVTLVLRADTRPGFGEDDDVQVPPPKPQWVELNCQTAGFILDRDVIDLKTADLISALRLRASVFDVEIAELSVKFANGTREVFPLRSVIPSGGITGAIVLREQRRPITQIELVHRSRVLSNQKARLCVEGLKSVAEIE
jgi:hypothetical protein